MNCLEDVNNAILAAEAEKARTRKTIEEICFLVKQYKGQIKMALDSNTCENEPILFEFNKYVSTVGGKREYTLQILLFIEDESQDLFLVCRFYENFALVFTYNLDEDEVTEGKNCQLPIVKLFVEFLTEEKLANTLINKFEDDNRTLYFGDEKVKLEKID